jgi:hypothetical protein
MKYPRQKTSIRMKEARERLDAFEAHEVLAEPEASGNRTASVVVWICVAVLALAVYLGVAWLQRR